MVPVTVIGDSLVDVDVIGTADRVGPEGCLVLDVDHERRRPGAAALAATFAAADGAAVRFVTALSGDDTGRWLRRELEDAGVEVVDLGLRGATPQKWRFRGADGTVVRADHHCREVAGIDEPVGAGREALAGAAAVLVADYGRGVTAAMLPALRAAMRSVPVIWDPHPRGSAPPRHLDLLVPNAAEARRLVATDIGDGADRAVIGGEPPERIDPDDLDAVARRLAVRLDATVAVTCGPDGAVVGEPGGPVVHVPTRAVFGDTCGAGDRLAARVAVARAHGAPAVSAVVEGVDAATRFVSSGAAARSTERSSIARDPFELAAATRASGGRVVAAGGCFDLLHAGHVELLESSRALGDCLIVCLNSNHSIRRLKGSGRPIVDEADRRRILEALQCVDAVAVFDELTPIPVLERLRPHVFAKGGDYRAADLPEREVMARWGGTVAILPLVDDRSTTSLIRVVQERAAS